MKSKKNNILGVLELSPLQEGILFDKSYSDNISNYHIQNVFSYKGRLSEKKLNLTLNFIAQKYPVLKSKFVTTKTGSNWQVFVENNIPKSTMLSFESKEKQTVISSMMAEDIARPFSPENGDVFRLSFSEITENETVLLISFHHIIMDGWSLSILFSDFLKYYSAIDEAKSENTVQKMLNNERKFDYIKYREQINRKNLNEANSYWSSIVSNYKNTKKLPFKTKEKTSENQVSKETMEISKEVSSKLINLAAKSQVSLSSLIETCWGVLLQKYYNTKDIVFGKIVSGRNENFNEIEKAVGLFINTIPVRIILENDDSIIELIRKTQIQNLNSEKFDYYPLYEIQKKSKVPLFETLFVFENYFVEQSLKQERGWSIENNREQVDYDITLTVSLNDNLIKTSILFNPQKFSDFQIRQMLEHLLCVFETIVENEEIKVDEITVCSVNDKKTILENFNDTKVDFPSDVTVVELFEKIVNENSQKIAISINEREITYSELNIKSNQLARTLRDKGVKTGSYVALLTDRGIEMVVGILGIIKAGGVYVPIDVDLPQKRIEYILSDCRPTVVVSNKTSIETNITIIPLECDDSYSNNGNNLERVNKPSDLIYTIYTSGTTGKPKGVLIEHGNVIKLVKNNGFIKWSREKRILQAGSYSFDSITFELWGALLNGIELAIVDKDTFLNFNKLEKFVSRRKITTAFFTTALFNQIVLENIDVFDHIDSVIYGGEQNSPKLVELLLTKKRKIKILHAYGPTEATTFSTIHQINALEKNKKNIIGKPISNTYIYIMKNKKLCGIGIPGELCIAGKGVARGYLNQRNLTKEKFISNPFGDGTMYKSGDLARWLPDGTIEYMGRIDNQVKLRGFRIELSEVESALLNVEGIIECAVTLRLNNENIAEDLNVYYVSNKSFDSKSILKYLKRVLPSYMIPNYYLRMDRLPLTNNGKIDKRSLPIIEKESTIEYVQPKTRLEKQIASAFEKVLFKESIGIDDDFFELGGHSLRAAKVVNQLRVELQTEIEVRNIFEYSSVRELAQYLGDLEKSNYHSIPIAENKQYYEMTSSQKRLFFLEKLNPKSIIYNMPGSLSFYEEIDLDRLELALYNLFKRHEILRTTFHMFKGKAVQKIHEFIQPDIRIISERNNLVRPFDLETGPLVRVYILKNESGFCEIFFDMHHIISDGMSLKIFIDELTSLYRGETLRPLKLQYKDYSEWINSKDLSKQQTYWHKILENSSRLELLTDYQRPQNRDFSGKTYSSFYGKEIFNHVREIAKERHVSEYMVVLSALMIVLSHYSHQEDILIGTPVSGRIHKDTEELLGMFVNTLVLRAKPNGEKNYGIFINEIKQLCLDNLENQEYPFEQLVEETITERDLSRNPLFDVIYNWQNNEVADGVLGKYTEWGTISENNVSKFDLAFNFQEASGNLQVGITYCKSLFSEKTIELLFHHLKTTLLNLPKSSDVRIKDIQINDLDEVNEVINFNQIEFPEKNNKFVIDLFEEQVNNHPEKVALIFENKKISYRELNQKANQLGRYLRDYGVGPNDLVAIVTERSFEMIISILGILKAGGAYIPIDPDTPEGRIQYILSDSHPKLVLTYKVELSTQLFSVDLSDPSVFNRPNSNLKKVNSINDLAYCIYTSGTTGSPKGVLIEHGSVLNYCIADHGFRDLFIKENSTVLSLTTYGFDIFINESIYPLTHGSKIIITNKEEQANSHELLCLVEKYGVTVIGTTPSKIKLILEDKHTSNPINSLELLILGGEVLKEKLVDEIVAASDADIYNCYGPTEATVLVTESKIEKNKSITIGKPVPNSSIFIMNDGYICGIGVPGELCIAGKGVARGYLNRPELTNERFVDNPFGEGKLYRSGDLARWLPDGNLEYLGRMDDQIKLRGFRIELAEIENALREIDGVVNSAVTVKFSSSNEPEALNAYYVTDSNLANDEIRSNLKKVLPSYMVPQYYLELDALPITSNGKLDRKALPEITVTSSNAYCAPETKTQKVLVSAFEDILEKELIGIDDDFFELGGHSLRAARLTNHLSAMTKKKVQVRDIFEYPTVRLLAEHLESEADHIYQSIPVAEEKEVYAMTSAQRRLYLLDQLNPESIVYNLPGQLEFTEALDIDKLKSALYTLVQRHEILRTTFHLQNEQAVQKIHDDLKPEIRWHQEGEPLVRPFDLEEGPLVRVTILENEPTHSTIFFDMHHIISDGASLKIFADELTALYQEKQLPELNHQHKDYSEWLNLQDMEASKEYWHTTLKDPVQLELPTDYSRPKNRSFKGKTFGTSLGVELSKQIKELAHETKTTEYMIGLSALMILLSRYSQQDDIIIGSAVSGRTHKDTESMLGMFVNTLAFRGHPTKEKTYSSFLNEIKTLCLENYAHQEYPFEELVEDLVIERDQSRSPLFDVMFNWQNNEQITSAVNDTFKHSYLFDEIASKFDISFSVSEGKGEYLLSVTYRSDLYDEKTIQYLVEHFRTILTQVLNSSKRERAIYELSTTSEEEKKKLLEVFNKAESNSQSSQTLVDLFEISVEKNPLKTALVFKDKELSFQSLNEKANQLARKLRERGVRSNTLVPLITESSMEMVIGILGILKAGGAYVPVDPKLSDERIDHILSDCSAEVVVTNQKKIRQSISVIDLTIQEVFSGESRNLNLIRKAEDLAYCIYTSGTTGHPKGVLVEHHSIVDYVQFDKWKLDVSESLFLSKYHFDLGYTTFYLSLLNGGCLHLIDEEIVLEPYLLVDYLIQNKITLFKMTPSQLATLIDVMYIYSPQKFKYLKHVIVGGEEIRSEDLYKLQEWLPEVELFNHYGPTETTIGVLVSPIDKEVLMRKNSILGRPINHNQIYIMNDDQLSGIGVPGEIYIAGEGVSRGYLNQPELTKKKFVKNPFHKGKMYRSGDLARWLPNGNIEYLGRIDDQIKLHGFRIELAEIENTLRALKNIIDCVVSVRTSEQGDPEGLNAYYVCATPLDSSEIRGQLTQLLPSYMVPQYYKELSAIPVTANGKVDRKSLPEIETASYSVYVAPKTELEVLLATNFEKILEKESIGIDDNFFDLGGHSLRAAHLINLLQPLLEKQIFVRDLFEHPTVRSLANYLETGKMFSYQSIPKAEEKEYYEMPSAQKRMYLLYKLDPESITYNMPRHLTFSKSLNINNLRSTLQKMVERHEILRTTFHLFNDQPVQKIHSHLEIDFEEITEDVTRKLVQPFDLENGPLFRVRVIKKENETWSLFLDMHHIISDGLSIKVFSDELSSLYQGNLLPLPERQYKDYSEWLNHKDYSRQQKYWHTLLKNPVQLNIPTDYPRPKNRSTAGKTIFNSFGKELSHQIKRIAKQRRVSEYMVVLSALMVVLSRYGQQEDIMIGSPVSGRTHKDTELMLGLFANTLVFRGYPEKEKTFATFLDEIKHMCLSNYDYQEYPFENLVDELVTDRDFSRNPLFDVMLIWQNNEKVTQVLNEEIGFEIDNRLETTKFDLSLTVRENQGEYQFAFTYSTDLYQEETIEKIAGHLCTFLGHISPEGETRIEEVSMVDEEEEVYLTKVLNDTKQEYPKGDTIVDLFEKSVQRNEEKTAVIFEGKEITYQELNRKANQLARDLRRQGVKPDNLVAMITTRSVEMLIGILGILKAGGAYVPIDPNFPAERIHYILSDAKPKVILTYGTTIETNTPVIDLKTDEWKQNEDTNLPKVNTPKDLVYCLYTSGTTGNPKGVLIEHQNLVNYCTVDHEFDGNAIACTTNYTFDIFGTEFFWPLVNGKKVIYFFEDFDMSCSDWQFVDMLNTTPTKLRIIIENHSGILQSGQIKNILLIGEELTYTFLTDIKKHTDAKIYNCYGPTEATILVSEFKAVHTPKITIGKPSKNCQIYIMSGNQLNGIGITGELCIAGDGVGRGYLNRPELTNERFVENPFGEGKLYRSGDLARWLPDGNLEYLGRMDDQIKLRGFRIELAEIENTLREIDGVVNSAVTVKFSSSNEPEALNAYYVTSIELSVEEIRSNLKKVLPSYMVPQYYLELDALPITSNGKLDRKALPEIAVTSSNAYCAPETKTQKVLVSAFEDILEKELIGIDDDFFELGGHSLKAAQLTNHLSALTKKEVKVRDIFEYSTVRLLARHLENQKELSNETIPFADKKDYYKMTSAQKRLYLLDQFNPEGIVYNMPGLLEFSEILDIKKLENALCLLVHRHEILRTTFQLQNDQAVQKIHDDLKPEISWHQEGEPLVRPFDLEEGPLVRVTILENELNHSVIFFDMHHIISDGASLKIFADELTALYQGTQLPQITHQHKDYSEWLNHKDMEVSKKYWHNLLEDPPKSNIITDYPRPKNQSFIGETVKSYLGKEITEKVKSFARATGTTEFMIVLSALMIVLSRYSRQEDIMVGSSISGRTHKETETMLGMFVNTLVFRGKPLKNKKYLKYLTEVKEMCLNNYSHQMYPFERLVEELIEDRDFSRNPFFDVMLVWQNNDQFENESVTVSDNLGNSNVTKFDLSISVIEKAKGYEFKLTFCSEIFSKETAEIMLTHLKEMISNLIAIKNDDQIISEISMITDSEKMVLIDTFNPIINEGYGEDTVIDLFENSVKRNPNRVAIVFENREITYSELNCRANQLARYLSDHGVKKGTFVAMYTQRSIEMAIGILAIIKAGAAYVPIDTEYPDERIQYILSDSQPVAILTYETYIETDVPIIDLSNKSIYLNNNTNNLIVQNSSSDLLNCIYTSGTTGNPKGVLVEHKNLVNFCKIEHPFDYTIFEGEFLVVLGFTTFAFDIFANEFFYPLSKGGKIILASCDEQKDTFQLLKMVDKYGVTFIGSTPSRLKTMLEIDKSEKYLSSLKLIYLGGEILSDALVSSIHDKSTASLFNCYGPTEATVQVTEGQIFNEITIGKPSQNTQIFILENDSLCGIGVPGELCIAGNGLARGYLNQPELTKEKFTENPFGVGRIYHTGDLARWLPNGTIDYLGRIDRQVKLHGYRIELAEIENAMNAFKEVLNCVVTLRKSDESESLNVYYVSKNEIAISEIQKKLKERLPLYMIPQFFMQLETLPITNNGKIDVEALPEISISSTQEYVAPESEIELIISNIFESILNIEKIGMRDNFFELGGDSIKAMRIRAKLRDLGFDLPIQDIMEGLTIEQLIHRIKTFSTEESQELISGGIEKTPIIRMFDSWNLKKPSHFNQAIMLKVDGISEIEIKKALREIVFHHDMLRMTYKNNQILIPEKSNSENFEFESFNLKGSQNLEKEIECITNRVQSSFDLANGPLFKGILFDTAKGKSLMLCAHHLVVDGVSWRIIIEDFKTLTDKEQDSSTRLPLKTTSYKKWSEALLDEMPESEQFSLYWPRVIEKIRNVTNAPDKQHQVPKYGMIQKQVLKDDQLKRLFSSRVAFNTEINDLLLAAFCQAVKKWTDSKYVPVYLEGHGRENISNDIDVSRTVGWFTSVFPVNLYAEDDISDLIISTKEILRSVPLNGLSYGVYYKEDFPTLNIQYGFNYLGDAAENEELFADLSTGEGIDKSNKLLTPISFNGFTKDSNMNFFITFDQNLYSEESVRILGNLFSYSLIEIIDFCSAQNDSINTLSDIGSTDLSEEEIDALNDLFK